VHSAAAPAGGARPTSRDVARAAGVSQATVSLVMAGKWPGRVSERTAQAVREAARALGYRPNADARNLRLGRTRTALLVVPATHEYFGEVYAGASRVAAEHGFGVVLYPSPQGLARARDPFASARAALDGVIASSMAAEAVAAVRGGSPGGETLPLVMLDSAPEGEEAGSAAAGPYTTVNHDMAGGMRQVVEHLVGLGHRRITHVAAALDSWTFRVRARAFRAALEGVPGAVGREERAELSVAGGRAAARRALAGPGPRPTALVCDDDVLAAGACKAVRRLGLAVPDDVSVSGFADLALATALDPELTSVRLPAEELGARGMTALLALLEGRALDQPDLPVELAARGSTGPARGL
jgi:LacI family transcriptional regulator, repressor for deo operon, udp, cdd, tsx, nupC, and nupG